ncbi:hypothetical protein ABZ767_29510, partial [Streptomyces pseudogriseolus]|uniref:hypothetical protein n=1 Tax=Streptomyces pseudogriseolus TaxID=36817 RepID=UPI00347C5D20
DFTDPRRVDPRRVTEALPPSLVADVVHIPAPLWGRGELRERPATGRTPKYRPLPRRRVSAGWE